METFNTIVYLVGAVTTALCIVLCLVLFFACRSRDEKGRRIELDSKSPEQPWPLGLWIAGVFVAGDCRSKFVRQLTTAVADGATAALAACRYINGL